MGHFDFGKWNIGDIILKDTVASRITFMICIRRLAEDIERSGKVEENLSRVAINIKKKLTN